MRILMILAFCTGSAAQAGVDLRTAASDFAGQAVPIDPRLTVPDCPQGWSFAWREGAARALRIGCAGTGWHLVVPIGGADAVRTPVMVRRGEPVRVRVRGGGYQVTIDGIAEADAAAGARLKVRNPRTGQRFVAELGADGALILAESAGGI